jgi:RNA polymerase sigma-70 factor (ECF subfamily)
VNLEALTDEGLVSKMVSEGSEEAAGELFGRYRQKVYLWCFGYTRNAEDALDYTQEIFIKVFRGAHSFAGRARFSTWVYRIARNHCLAELARKRDLWRRRSVPIEGNEEADTAFLDHLRETEMKGELDRLLSEAARRMKPEELQAFVLHYREGLTVKEITRILRCENVTGARTLIQGARRKFRRMLGGGGEER